MTEDRSPRDSAGGEEANRPDPSSVPESPAPNIEGTYTEPHPLERVTEIELGAGRRMRVLVPGGLPAQDLERHLGLFREFDRRLREIKARLTKEDISEAARHVRRVLPKPMIANAVAQLTVRPLARVYEERTRKPAGDVEGAIQRLTPLIEHGLSAAVEDTTLVERPPDIYYLLAQWWLAQFNLRQQLEIERAPGKALKEMGEEEPDALFDQWWERKTKKEVGELTDGLILESLAALAYCVIEVLDPTHASPKALEWLLGREEQPDWFLLEIATLAVKVNEGGYLGRFFEDTLQLKLYPPLQNADFLDLAKAVEQRGWERAHTDPVGWLRSRSFREARRQYVREQQKTREEISLSAGLPPDSVSEFADFRTPEELSQIEEESSYRRFLSAIPERDDTDRNLKKLLGARLRDPKLTFEEAARSLNLTTRQRGTVRKRLQKRSSELCSRLKQAFPHEHPPTWVMKRLKR